MQETLMLSKQNKGQIIIRVTEKISSLPDLDASK